AQLGVRVDQCLQPRRRRWTIPGRASWISGEGMTVIDVEGVFNVRDVGGIPTSNGRIRAGRLLRSGNLVDASSSGVAELERRISHIVDLRDGQEVASAP